VIYETGIHTILDLDRDLDCCFDGSIHVSPFGSAT
jgi:hypothetical protein